MIHFEHKTKTIICIGSGGVGKTTISAALGVGLSLENKKILVMTIDPSQRLAQALGIKADGEIHQVQENLFACTLNHEQTFKNFITEASQKIKSQNSDLIEVEKLLKNKLYQQLSTKLSGSQDFTALYQLQKYVESKVYDIVILDTPPAQHTWQFLHSAEKLAQLFNEGVAQWFREADQKNTPFLKKVLNIGTQQVLKTLESLTGSEFIKELSAFFSAVQKWQTPLEKQVWAAHKLLSSQETEFVLVTGLDRSRLDEAQKLSHEIYKQGYNLKSIIINRSLNWNLQTVAKDQTIQQYLNYFKQLQDHLTESKSKFGSHLKVYKCQEVGQDNDYVKTLKNIYEKIQSL